MLFILLKVILPDQHGAGLTQFDEWMQQLIAMNEAGQKPELNNMPEPGEEMIAMFQFIQQFLMAGFWAYFFISEIFMKGASLGKKVFNLRIININTARPVGLLDSSLRAIIKSLFFFIALLFPPILLNYFMPLFNSNRRAGHDYICKTLVIEDDGTLLTEESQ